MTEYQRLARVLPVWARRCLKAGHDISLLDKPDGRVEVFCGDCLDGAGQGEILTASQTAILVSHFATSEAGATESPDKDK